MKESVLLVKRLLRRGLTGVLCLLMLVQCVSYGTSVRALEPEDIVTVQNHSVPFTEEKLLYLVPENGSLKFSVADRSSVGNVYLGGEETPVEGVSWVESGSVWECTVPLNGIDPGEIMSLRIEITDMEYDYDLLFLVDRAPILGMPEYLNEVSKTEVQHPDRELRENGSVLVRIKVQDAYYDEMNAEDNVTCMLGSEEIPVELTPIPIEKEEDIEDPGELEYYLTFSAKKQGLYEVTVTDWVGNEASVTVDLTSPVLTVSSGENIYGDGDTVYLRTPGAVLVQAQDTGSGLATEKCTLTVNGASQDFPDGSGQLQFGSGGFPEGYYTIGAYAEDLVGNSASLSVKCVYDRTAPAISRLDSYAGEETDGKVSLRYRVEDNLTGVAGVYWSTQENDAGTALTETEPGIYTVVLDPESDSRYREFDGTVYLWAVDSMGNTSEKHAQKVCIHTPTPAPAEPVTSLSVSLPDTPYLDGDGLPLYNAYPTARVTVTDTANGIQTVEWSVYTEDGSVPGYSDAVTVSGKSALDGAWRITGKSGDAVTSVTGEIPVSLNTNGILLTVRMTDRSGGIREQTLRLSVDTTAPEVKVTFDNNRAKNGSYYDDKRTATVTVTEHNFDESLVQLTGYGGAVRWSHSGDTHTAILNFSQDGTYAFDIAATDMAGNLWDAYAGDSFTIDTKKPDILLENVKDKTAYNDTVAPVITVTDAAIVRSGVTVTLTKDGKPVDASAQVSEDDSGIQFTLPDPERTKDADGIYTLTVDAEDLAGNRAQSTVTYSVNRFGSAYEFDDSTRAIRNAYVSKAGDLLFWETNVSLLEEGSIRLRLSHDGQIRTLEEGTEYTVLRQDTDAGWSRYEYTVFASVFAEDGVYRLFVQSTDEAKNLSSIDGRTEDGMLIFAVDSTSPMILVSGLESGSVIAAAEVEIPVEFTDNLLLSEAEIYVNGELAASFDGDTLDTLENGRTSFRLHESARKQSIRIVLRDAAGNETQKEYTKVLVNTSWLMRFLGTYGTALLIAAAVLAAGILALSYARRKKRGAVTMKHQGNL